MLAGRKFVFSASTLALGTAAAQFVTFAFSFILTRLYDSAEYGHYSIVVGCAAVLGALATGSYEKLILLARTEGDARRARYLVALLSVGVAGLVWLSGLAVWLLEIPLPSSLKLTDLLLLLPIFVLGLSASNIFVYSSLRHGRMSRIAVFKAGQSLVMGASQAVLSAFKALPGMTLGHLIGLGLVFAGACRWYLLPKGERRPTRLSLIATARRNMHYPRYVMPNEVVDTFSNQVPLFLIGTVLALGAAGHYSLAMMMLSAPAALVGQAVGQAFLQYISREQDDPRVLRKAMILVWLGMATLGLAPFTVILFFGEWIFSLAFGRPWAEAGAVAGLLAPLLLVRFISSPTSGIYLRLKMQREQWYFCVAAAAYRLGAYSLLLLGLDLHDCILIHTALEILGIVAYNWIAMRRLKVLALEPGSRLP